MLSPLLFPLVCGTCLSSEDGVALRKHSYQNLPSSDLYSCYRSCKEDATCQSVNFHKITKTCEFNNRTRRLREHHMDRSAVDVIYFDNPLRGIFKQTGLSGSCISISVRINLYFSTENSSAVLQTYTLKYAIYNEYNTKIVTPYSDGLFTRPNRLRDSTFLISHGRLFHKTVPL